MANSVYMNGRRKNLRPQGMLWAEGPGSFDNGVYVPEGLEVGFDPASAESNAQSQFIILSDDNRGPMFFSIQRIETRERMINGRLRSHHIADKLSLSVSWQMLPSRSFSVNPEFDTDGNPTNLINSTDHDNDVSTPEKNVMYSGSPYFKDQQYTSDGGAGGAEMLDWYDSHQGSFWVYLAYDKHTSFGKEDSAYQNLNIYNQAVEMFFSDFTYSVQKRGGSNHDLWDISLTLEEV